ncbi:MAG: acyl-CoA thioesterase [Bdellovibrionales bacterium]|nr:acyl-CoA thioesterase [Oligoflexia bacterium]
MNVSEFPVHDYRTLIRERHLDSFGHVNNAQYSVLFEEARWEMISSRGYSLKCVHESQVGTVVLESTIRFKRELRLREEITIQTKVHAVSRKIITLKHLILKESGELAAEASFTLGCFDLQTRKLRSPTQDWLSAVTGIKIK